MTLRAFRLVTLAAVVLTAFAGTTFAADVDSSAVSSLVDVQKYNRAIHIMAMLLVGFGFLMVFVKRYGHSAVTATYLLVSLGLPLYFLKDKLGILGASSEDIDSLILAEFAAASLLICAGAVLGRLKMMQYLLLALLFIPAYALNEWILQRGGLGFIPAGVFTDTGGSVVIHAFGAFFGLGAIFFLTSPKEFDTTIEVGPTTDRFSMVGSMMLWIFWPSFCAALVPPADVPKTAVNVILALCASTLSTYLTSVGLRKKIAIADIANAALAGGVAIGSTCDKVQPLAAFIIGIMAGGVSTFGFTVVQPRLQALTRSIDTCGVLYLHGLPGLFGGLVALFAVKGINSAAQLKGILITVLLAAACGLIAGRIISWTGRRVEPYLDKEEFLMEQAGMDPEA